MTAFETRAEFHAWLEREGLAHVARFNLEAVAPYVEQGLWPQLRSVGARRRLSDLASRDGVASSLEWLKPSRLREVLPDAVSKFIEAEKAAADKARTQTERLAAPADARAIAVHQRLILLRERLPPSVAPRLRELLDVAALQFDKTLPGFEFRDLLPTEMPLRQGGGFARARVKLTLRENALTSTCTCGATACVHQLAAIDAALVSLDSQPGTVLDELARPSWQRTLDALQAAVTASTPRAAPTQLTFRLAVEGDDGVRVTAWVDGEQRLREALLPQAGVDAPLVALLPGPKHFASRTLLEGLVDSPRVFLERDPTQTVRIERVAVGLVAEERGGAVTLAPGIEGAAFPPYLQERVRSATPDELLYLWDEGARRLTLLDVSVEVYAAVQVLAKEPAYFPPEAQTALLESLSRLAQQVPVAMPRSVMGEPVPVQMIPVLRLEAQRGGGVDLELRVKALPDAAAVRPGEGPRDVHLRRGLKAVHTVRDLRAEEDFMRALEKELPLAKATPNAGRPFLYEFERADEVFDLLEAASLRAEPPQLEWVGKPLRNLGVTGPSALKVTVQHELDWFGALGEMSVFGERVELARLIEAARRDARFVEVQPQTYIEIPEVLREHLRRVAAHTTPTKTGLQLTPASVTALQALRNLGAAVEGDAAWRKFVERVQAARELTPEVPASLTAKLRPYQTEGFAWLTRLGAWGAGGVLADDMGLGKTLQALAVLTDRAELGPALVITPTSVAFNWRDEAKRFAPKLNVELYAEDRRLDAHAGDVIVISYGMLTRDAKKLASRRFATVVFDEAQQLKNPTTQRFNAAKNLKADFRFALSGTPIENHLGELWALYALVFPPLLGSWDNFRARFALPIEKRIDPAAAPELAELLRPFLLRRTKSEVAAELPPRTEVKVPVVLSTEEWNFYEDTRLAALSDLETPSGVMKEQDRRLEVLKLLTRLRLAASHPRLLDDTSTIESAKLARAVELLEELRAEGQRTLVFSQFTSHLALLRDRLDARGISYLELDGSTPAPERKARVKAFQEGTTPVFLISLKAGGFGLNLTAATNVVLLDPWWNPAVEDQAADRAHRLGQQQPVTIYRLVSLNTVEELMLAMHAKKRALISQVLEGKSGASKVSTDELIALMHR